MKYLTLTLTLVVILSTIFNLNGQTTTTVPAKTRSATVKTFNTFKTALSGAATRIVLGADIPVTENITIPRGKSIITNAWRFLETEKEVNIVFDGQLDTGRMQVFQGFEPGDIKGAFTTGTVYPEWWGLVGSNYDDGQHDIAINSAISTFQRGIYGNTISLAAGVYYISKPIDLRGSASRLVGAGSGATKLNGTKTWSTDKWEDCNSWNYWNTHGKSNFYRIENSNGKILLKVPKGGSNDFTIGQKAKIINLEKYNGEWTILEIPNNESMILDKGFIEGTELPGDLIGQVIPVTLDSVMEFGPGCHSSMIWIGGKTEAPTAQTFFTGVSGLTVSGYYPIRSFPNKRISGISWTGYVEELSFIKDVGVTTFSGFGIGGSHPSNITTVNGLTVTNFFISDATRKGAVGFYTSGHAGVAALRDGTMDFRISQNDSVDGNAVYKKTWPQFGALVSGGHTDINNVHFESTGNAIHVYAWSGPSSVTISNCDLNHGMDYKMRFHGDDAFKTKTLPSQFIQGTEDNFGDLHRFVFHYACLVSIGRPIGEYNGGSNYNSNVSIRNIRTLDNSSYLLRDWQYVVHINGNSNFRTPNGGSNSITSYDRSIPFGDVQGVPPNQTSKFYSPFNILTDREYFKIIK